MKLVSAWLRIPFWQRVLGGFVLGALAGWLLGPAAETWFGPLGDLSDGRVVVPLLDIERQGGLAQAIGRPRFPAHHVSHPR